ncbi:spore germination protein GerPB [Bacillus sp. FJAT-49736]|uniref:spore germination protein GerPB n=1 Tax=Bacillus sp. FJAT-49736 TaxID=2833582 RepID=UPI001BC94973|nr:spore germination protein GerPB [Bacillus sp. FJAT-49736]MBS4172012.1 spore gernimation protein [Bacillus sp. FJAT-49736]
MKIYLQQTIQIHMIKIGGISNSSVFQIGSAGIIKPASYLYNTGGFIRPAPKVGQPTPSEGTFGAHAVVPFQTSGGPR